MSLPSLPSLFVKSSFFSVARLVVLGGLCFSVAGGFRVLLVVELEATD